MHVLPTHGPPAGNHGRPLPAHPAPLANRSRESHLKEMPGFVRFAMLKCEASRLPQAVGHAGAGWQPAAVLCCAVLCCSAAEPS